MTNYLEFTNNYSPHENCNQILYFLVTKLMTTVVGLTGLKLAPRSLSSNKSWASGDEMAKEASESDVYFGGLWLKVK